MEAQDAEKMAAFSMNLYKIAEALLASRRESPRCPEEDPASSLLLEKNSEGNFLDNSQLM